MKVELTGDGGTLHDLRYWESDTLREIIQNIEIILSTPRGSVPMYREFGLDIEPFLDYPEHEAEIRMIAPVREAIEQFEPRATVRKVTFRPGRNQGQIIPCVEVDINAQST